MNALLPLYVRTEHFVRDRVEKMLNPQEDKGQAILEYVAILVFIVAIVTAALMSKTGQTVGKAFVDNVGKVLKGGG